MNEARFRLARVLAPVFACVFGLSGCRLGGGNPASPSEDDISLDAAASGGAAGRADASLAGGGGAGAPAPDPDAGPAAGAGGSRRRPPDTPGPSGPPRDAGSSDDPSEDSGSSVQPDAGSCSRHAPIDGCNPIANTGCVAEFGMQCDVDLLAPALSGICVFSAPAPTPDACLAIPPTETCPAKQTCVEGTCLTVCLCDADCGPGACCTDALDEQGWKTCSKC